MGLERALRRDARGGDVGAGAAGGAAAGRGARSGGRGVRGQSRAHRDLPRGSYHLSRGGRRGAAGAARGLHRKGRGTTLIRRTKIVATLGPATGKPEQIAGLIDAGVNVIRVNASHGTPELRAGWIAAVRQAADAAGVPVAVLWDLQGPRIRVGKLAEPRELLPGETVVFAPEEVARGAELPTTYDDLAADVRPGARILLDDGLLSVQVTRIAPPRVEGRVEDGGTLTSNKGMNLPGLHVSAPALTEKDREDAAHAASVGADPFEAVRAMDRIIREMERHGSSADGGARGGGGRDERRATPGGTVSVEDAIALGTSAVARMLRTPLIVTLTKGGFTARKVAALRAPVPILAVTTESATFRQLALVWGVTPVLVDHVPSYDAMLAVVRDLLLKRGYAQAGDRIVMTAGVPWEVSGATNLLKVEVV